ncbi:MAG: NfeD family protein [Filomicrobium sp.]
MNQELPDKPARKAKQSSQPSDLIWLLATLSLILPWIAAACAAVGIWRIVDGNTHGWALVAFAAGLLVLDVAIDLWLASPKNQVSDDPDLNRRGQQGIGRVVPLVSAIEDGRGKVKLGDSEWIVEGPEGLAAGSKVRIIGSGGTILKVEAAD